MNAIIELHDSTVSQITKQEGTIIVYFQSAYIHKSKGRPGLDSGTGWVQEARLVFSDASVSGDLPDLPCDIVDGELIVGQDRHENSIPVPFEVLASSELRLRFDSIHAVTVKGRGIKLELFGGSRHVEEFKP